ncbi:Hypothetical protein SMAX5B_022349 [Scophthalmus maximus]|uniref:Uncharacterized protein n=1 Tax=Scophthalmus maximus TaxID=52904 RepID=A0A2U9C243_SCOMX|nr:Hypothetical protein SMAX5B_022349 [Scophthalmus maximus]
MATVVDDFNVSVSQQRTRCREFRSSYIQGLQTIRGFEQICYALELDDGEEQHRGEWGHCELLKV